MVPLAGMQCVVVTFPGYARLFFANILLRKRKVAV